MKNIISGNIFLFLSATSAFADQGNSGNGWNMHHMMFGPFRGMMMIPMFIIILIFIFILVYFFRRGTDTFQPERFKEEGALEILKKRYARGEITKEEYEKMKKDIL